jgi:dynamin 1-like protein
MQNLIPVLNKLQDVFSTVSAHQVDLPQIVAVGCQSAGKSSVLEAIVGKDFLPRGAGICTRRPLILQLIHIDEQKEWGEFLHLPDKKFTDFSLICKEIEDETERVCGSNKGVTDEPINLKIFSNKVLNLTLVDLPGLTKIAVEDQPEDISEQIEKMVMNYITPKNAIILAISPANTDLANSDSLIAARKVDPNGDRTIGVITKIDIMDKGTNARDILLNKVYPLKLGYIGVINRSQADINAKKKVADTAAAEMKFFKNHEAYADIAQNCGTQFLSQTLNQILMKHIKNQIPALYTQINELLSKKNLELQNYGATLGDSIEEQQAMIFHLVSRYMAEFDALLNGTSDHLSDTELSGGANIISELIDEFPQSMLTIKSVKDTSQDLVAKMIENQGGLRGSMFFPEATFHALVKVEIEKLRECALKCIDKSKERLLLVHNSVNVPELNRFCSLRDNIQQIAVDSVVTASKEAVVYANKLIDLHTSYINTRHPDFSQSKQQIDASGGFGNNVPMLIDLVHRYFVIVRKEIIDSIPKAIYRTLLVDSVEKLRFDLVERLVLEPDLNEDPIIAEKRKSCIKLINALKQAQNVLADVRKAHV